ncbi:MAG: hypothetical protein JXX28_08005 [Deltaproteobacteria bacterium]|nr:hypothetical protein [Deltaproteobacteria bacterium]
MRWTGAVVAVVIGMSLACGGGSTGPAGASISRLAGPYAISIGEYTTAENGLPCPIAGVGEEYKLGDWTLVFEPTELVEPESRLPWISNSDERRMFGKEGSKALIVPFKVRNDSPVKKDYDVLFAARTTDGERIRSGPYNEKLYYARAGRQNPWDAGKLTPGQWFETAYVYSVDPAFVDGATIVTRLEEQRRDQTDPRGRMIDVTVVQHAVDLGPATEGEPLRQPDSAKPAPRVKR